MPEGHSVRRLAEAFEAGFAGQRLEVASPQGRFADGAALLDGGVLEVCDAWGKHLFLGVRPEGGGELRWLHVHLGLYGAWTFAGDTAFAGPHAIGAPRVRVGEEERPLRGDAAADAAEAVGVAADPGDWTPPEPRGQVRVRIVGEHGVADLTGPTRCEVLTAPARDAVVARLGPDPLRPDPGGEGEARFVADVRRRRTGIGVLLMDQAVLAGVGNIYRAELLYRARVHPLREGRSVAARTLQGIWRDAVVLMADGVATGRIVTTEAADRAAPSDAFYVYHRDGRPCLRCGTRVQVDDLAGRRVYWCPRCQRRR
ncbi:Fpg/Nei family DNA glycosylase [Litorihabitans aurantiacus]|uniref:DNA-(apurinic or apyrimidinic site) lyase n=1 Tax=Litorihabitans aurantiacus TaxID=1930061 RepID=A0AA37XFP8_9MICO|nr:zinc finger domain-containing protein [Litorihabitans aurantiacus]GMA31895.1 formamidopyrimidine-DNA glycosylase [Litorihabitans aurantiacus]